MSRNLADHSQVQKKDNEGLLNRSVAHSPKIIAMTDEAVVLCFQLCPMHSLPTLILLGMRENADKCQT
jgi:hypothetical protein